MILKRVKLLLGLQDDNLQDDVIKEIIDLTCAHLGALVGSDKLYNVNYIIIDVVIKRYNRLGSEGYTSKSIEGLKMDFDTHKDFDEYLPILKKVYPDAFSKSGVKFI